MNSMLLTAALAALLGAACGRPTSDPLTQSGALRVKAAGTTVDGTGGAPGATLACPSPTVCFQLATDGANITHVFIDVDACCAASPDDYDVLVDGQPVKVLHDHGGPCGDIARDAWFPLQGNQSAAEVCLQFHGFVPGSVSVGAKAKSECVATAVTAACAVCAGGAAVGGCADGGSTGERAAQEAQGAPAARAARGAQDLAPRGAAEARVTWMRGCFLSRSEQGTSERQGVGPRADTRSGTRPRGERNKRCAWRDCDRAAVAR